MPKMWTVPRMWEGQTVVCVATGPSSSPEQIDKLRGYVKVIAVNDAYLHAPFADLHYFADPRWYNWHAEGIHPSQHICGYEWSCELFKAFADRRVTLMHNQHIQEREPELKLLKNDSDPGISGQGASPFGLCLDPSAVRTGRNSGYQVINIAVHTRPKRILLIAYDMRDSDEDTHWFGKHPQERNKNKFEGFAKAYESLVEPLSKLNIQIFNCTPNSGLKAFPYLPFEEALEMVKKDEGTVGVGLSAMIANPEVQPLVPRRDNPHPNCPLCIREEKSKFYYEDDEFWVVDCISCKVPMIVWKKHVPRPHPRNIARIRAFGQRLFPGRIFDDGMRKVRDHYHVHFR